MTINSSPLPQRLSSQLTFVVLMTASCASAETRRSVQPSATSLRCAHSSRGSANVDGLYKLLRIPPRGVIPPSTSQQSFSHSTIFAITLLSPALSLDTSRKCPNPPTPLYPRSHRFLNGIPSKPSTLTGDRTVISPAQA